MVETYVGYVILAAVVGFIAYKMWKGKSNKE